MYFNKDILNKNIKLRKLESESEFKDFIIKKKSSKILINSYNNDNYKTYYMNNNTSNKILTSYKLCKSIYLI